jgi:hypothetical protein
VARLARLGARFGKKKRRRRKKLAHRSFVRYGVRMLNIQFVVMDARTGRVLRAATKKEKAAFFAQPRRHPAPYPGSLAWLEPVRVPAGIVDYVSRPTTGVDTKR